MTTPAVSSALDGKGRPQGWWTASSKSRQIEKVSLYLGPNPEGGTPAGGADGVAAFFFYCQVAWDDDGPAREECYSGVYSVTDIGPGTATVEVTLDHVSEREQGHHGAMGGYEKAGAEVSEKVTLVLESGGVALRVTQSTEDVTEPLTNLKSLAWSDDGHELTGFQPDGRPIGPAFTQGLEQGGVSLAGLRTTGGLRA